MKPTESKKKSILLAAAYLTEESRNRIFLNLAKDMMKENPGMVLNTAYNKIKDEYLSVLLENKPK